MTTFILNSLTDASNLLIAIDDVSGTLIQLKGVLLSNIVTSYQDVKEHKYFKAGQFKPLEGNVLDQTAPPANSGNIPFDQSYNNISSYLTNDSNASCDALCSADVNCQVYHEMLGQCTLYKATPSTIPDLNTSVPSTNLAEDTPCQNEADCLKIDSYVKINPNTSSASYSNDYKYNLSLIATKLIHHIDDLEPILTKLRTISSTYTIEEIPVDSFTLGYFNTWSNSNNEDTINSDTNTINAFLKHNEHSAMSDESRTNVLRDYNSNLFYLILICVLAFIIVHYAIN